MDIKFANYGQARDVNATPEEVEIFDIIRSLCDDVNLDSELLGLMRKSDDYVTVVLPSPEYGPVDVARIKFTPRAKWIKLHPHFDKLSISSPDDVARIYAENVREAYRENIRYL